jgi:hypothetical protein
MFVASLNLDVFFKKVFSNKKIAKNFLQDFFNVKITEIKLLATDHKVTDDATLVRFDFRCKINGKYKVIEMQQKYKTDVNKRFYLYHCLGTALQLETLEPKVITKLGGETYTEKNYGGLEPVITLIWMVDDTLNFTDDYVAFTTLPEATKDFISDDNLWKKPFDTILEEREKTLKIVNNDTKNLDFFSQNRLIYAFQRNIIQNKHNSAYFKWFDLANKSRNFNNVEKDFSQFNNDEIMVEVIKRLRKDRLAPKQFKFVSDLPLYEAYYLNQQIEFEEKAEKSMMLVQQKLQAEQQKVQAEQQKVQAEQQKVQAEQQKVQAEQQKFQAEQQKFQAEQQKFQAEQQKVQAEQQKLQAEQQKVSIMLEKQLKSIEKLLKRGDDIPSIADLLELSIEEVTVLVEQIRNK